MIVREHALDQFERERLVEVLELKELWRPALSSRRQEPTIACQKRGE